MPYRTTFTSSWKAWSTFILLLADASMKGMCNCLATSCPSSGDTWIFNRDKIIKKKTPLKNYDITEVTISNIQDNLTLKILFFATRPTFGSIFCPPFQSITLSNLPVGQICLVCHKNHGKFISVFDPQYLFVKFENFVEWGFVGDGVDEEEPFTGPHVLFTHGREFFLTSCVQD